MDLVALKPDVNKSYFENKKSVSVDSKKTWQYYRQYYMLDQRKKILVLLLLIHKTQKKANEKVLKKIKKKMVTYFDSFVVKYILK